MSRKLEEIADSIEEVSSKFEKLSETGENMFEDFDNIEEASDSLENISDVCEDASGSISNMNEAFSDAGEGIEDLTSSVNEAEGSMESIVGSADEVSESLDDIESNAQDMSLALEDAAGNAQIAGEAFSDTGSNAEELSFSLSEASEAMGEFSASAQDVADAAYSISESAGSIGQSMSEIGENAEEAGNSLQNAGSQGSDAINNIASAIGGAAIALSLQDIITKANEMTEAFSEAQKTIVNATGATGETLADLSNSALDSFGGSHEALSDVAGAVGEINTRMALTGDELTEMTDKFLDFSDITGQNVVGSVQSVSKVLNQWGLDVSDTGVLMDKLAATGEKTGISVSNLSNTLIRGAGSFKAAGLDLDDTINLLGNFETVGINSSQGIMAMRTAVTKLGKSGGDVKKQLMDAVDEIAHMRSETEAATKASELFGTRAGQSIASGIRSGIINADSFNASLENTRGTMQLTADAGESLSDKWTTAFNNIQAGLDKAITPAVSSVSEVLADAANGIGDFLNDNQEAATTLASIATGVGVATAAFAGFNGVMHAISSIQTGTGILGWLFGGVSLPAFAAVAGGIALITGAFMEYADETKKVEDQLNSETPWTRQTREELESLEEEYQILADKHQLGTERAQSMKLKMDELTRTLEENGQSMEQLNAEMDSYFESHDALMERIDQETSDYESQLETHDALLSKIERGAKGNEAYGGSIEQLKSYFDLLNKDVGITSTNIEEFGQDAGKAFNKLRAETLKSDFMEGVEAQYKNQIDLQEDLKNLESEQTKVTESHSIAQEKLNELYEQQEELRNRATHGDYRSMADLGAGIDTEHLNSQIAVYEQQIAQFEEDEERLKTSIEGTKDAINDSVEPFDMLITQLEQVDGVSRQAAEGFAAAGMAIENNSQQLALLAENYQQTYASMQESFEGIFGLFDQAKIADGHTMEELNASLDSQTKYWESYAANVAKITDWLGKQSEETKNGYAEFMDYISTASPEAAAAASDMVNKINEGNDKYLQEIGTKFEKMAEVRDTAAKDLTDYQTKINDTLKSAQDQITKTLQESEGVSEKAKEAGKRVLDQYFNGLNESLHSGDVSGFVEKLQDGFSEVMTLLFEGGFDPDTPIEQQVNFNGDTSQLEQDYNQGKQNIENNPAEANVTGNTADLENQTNQAVENIENKPATVHVRLSTVDEVKKFRELDEALSSGSGTTEVEESSSDTLEVKVKANTSEIEPAVSKVISSVNKKEAKFKVTADITAADKSLTQINTKGSKIKITIPVSEKGSSDVIKKLNEIKELGDSIHPVIEITETGAEQVMADIRSIENTANAISPVVIRVTDEGGASAIADEINSIPTEKTVKVKVNEETTKKSSGHWQGTLSSESNFYAGEMGPELIVKPIAKYAEGTTFSDGMYIAGENGPELITGAPGSTVFPTSETNRIIEALSKKEEPLRVFPSAGGGTISGGESNNKGKDEKHIYLDINGNGAIEIRSGSMTQEQVLEILQQNMKPVLMNIIQSEIYEEGDLSYDY